MKKYQLSKYKLLLFVLMYLFYCHSFKKLALKNHPLKNAEHMEIHLEKFHEICEAYEILINRKLHETHSHNSLYEANQFFYGRN